MEPQPGEPVNAWRRIADCGALRLVALDLSPGQRVREHRNAIPVTLIVTHGELRYREGDTEGVASAGDVVLVNPGERHAYWSETGCRALLVFAGLPGVRARPWQVFGPGP